MMKIKQTPEDFIVKEIINLKFDVKGDYTYYELTKRDYTTIKAIEAAAKKLSVPIKNIKFAGAKDKRAVTTQHISIFHGQKKDFETEDIKLKYLGKGNSPISLGSLEGNYFEIKVYSDKAPRKIMNIVNYFDDQRFGKNKNNHIIGKHIIKGDFNNACRLIFGEERQNPISELRKLHKKTLMMYVHAYQSWLFNEAVKEYIKIKSKDYRKIEYSLGELFIAENMENVKVPILGFGIELNEFEDIYNTLMKKENIGKRDFVIRKIPDLSSEGDYRDLTADVKELVIEGDNNEYLLKFTLPKGSYATLVVKSMFE